MCGIVGVPLSSDATDPAGPPPIAGRAATLRHRGPDDGDFWIDHRAGIVLGHRRPAIVDLSKAGRQSMLPHDERLALTFNGKIYNFAELCPMLGSLGYVFGAHSASEVMLAAVEGFEKALRKFAGMFGFGLWDHATSHAGKPS